MRHDCGFAAPIIQAPCKCGHFNTVEHPWVFVPEPTPEPDTAEAEPVTHEDSSTGSSAKADADAEPVSPPAGAVSTWVCPRDQRENSVLEPCCVECGGAAPTGSFRLGGDAGEHALPRGGELLLGRSVAQSPAAASLAAFPNVGRTHALLNRSIDGVVTLTDLGSTNGTYIVEGGDLRRIPVGRPTAIQPDSIIQFGNDPNRPNARITFLGAST